MTNLLFFFTIFGYISNWKRLQFLPKALLNPKKNLKSYPNTKLVDKLSKKLGIKFEIKIQRSSVINGYMPGIPIKPIMILNQGALDKLNEKELEWVILHEAGHCLNWHTIKNTIAWLLFLIVGIVVVLNYNFSIIRTIIFSIMLAILWIQYERRSEIEVDYFSMISFFEKMNKEHPNFIYKNRNLGLLLSSHPNYKDRIKMAKKYL